MTKELLLLVQFWCGDTAACRKELTTCLDKAFKQPEQGMPIECFEKIRRPEGADETRLH